MRMLTVEEYKRVLKYLDPQPRLMVRLAVASGARWGRGCPSCAVPTWPATRCRSAGMWPS